MSTRRLFLVIGAMALASGCSRSESANGLGSAQTRRFLQEIGLVRSQMNADNAGRIPAMLRRQDSSLLTDQVARIGQYRLTLSKLDPSRVDPRAVYYEQGVEAALEAYRYVCLDTAEFFREVKESDAKQQGHAPLSSVVGAGMESSRGDTLAVLDSLLAAADDLDTSPNGAVFLAPILKAVRADRMRLKQALDAQQELAGQITADIGKG